MSSISSQVYLVHVLSRLPNDVVQTPRIFAEHVYRQRFSIIYPPDSLYMRRSAFNCIIGGSPEKHSELIQKYIFLVHDKNGHNLV